MLEINEYFDGQVKSIGFQSESQDGVRQATVGVMPPGDYKFGTTEHETLTVVSGALRIKPSGQSDWQTYSAGEVFEVEAGDSFELQVELASAYLCVYG